MLTETQIPRRYKEIIDAQVELFNKQPSITVRNEIPSTIEIPIQEQGNWLRIPGVICLYVDMLGSTKLSARKQDKETARAYQLYTGTAVRIFDAFEAPYIDVRGDGAFALFNSDQPFTALAAAVTFKTFATEIFVPKTKDALQIEVGSHMGIAQNTVLVRKIGMLSRDGRTDRQNEVWAGKPVNMAAKLASLSNDAELLVSDRFFQGIQNELALRSCGCGNENGEKRELWEKVDLSEDETFNFDQAFKLSSQWCGKHGLEYCEKILELD